MLRGLDLLRRDSLPESLDIVHPHPYMAITHHWSISGPCYSLTSRTAVFPALVCAVCGVEDG